MDALDKLFGSAAKVKIMKLFIFNRSDFLDVKSIVLRTKISSDHVRKEVGILEKSGLIKSKPKSGRKYYHLNESFPYLRSLTELMTFTISISYDEIVKKISKTCKLKSVILSGLFLNQHESRVDILIIGNQFNKNKLAKCMKRIETEIGKELSYAVLETDDFKYRLGVGDKLVRDVLEYPHQVAYDKMGLQKSK